jgi:acyl-CoA thioesterase I
MSLITTSIRKMGAAYSVLLIAFLLVAEVSLAQDVKPQPAATIGATNALQAPTLLVLGDSLSAGYGINIKDAWVSLLAQKLHAQGIRTVNAAISGETTAGGAARLAQALRVHQPRWLILELGANDALRGLPVNLAEQNLQRMLTLAQAAKVQVLLVGIKVPPNFGPEYTTAFAQMYQRLAKKNKVSLLPFLLEPIALDRDAFQDDNLHPVAAVQEKIMLHVWTSLAPMLAQKR